MTLKLICGDVNDVLTSMDTVKAIFFDPPDNLGLEYDGYYDRRDNYYEWIELLLRKAVVKSQIVWLSYYHEHDLEIKCILRGILRYHKAWELKSFVWTYGFGQYVAGDCGSGYRNIIRLKRADAQLYPEAIGIPSVRTLVGDKRAANETRTPDNVWNYPRVTGNSTQRRSWHPTQHPEALMERIIRFSCSKEETMLDGFVGSGTSLRVGRRIGHSIIGVEISETYCEKLQAEGFYRTLFGQQIVG